ncbi:CpsB/CapC family capsule biosynthesis tyrosine phosphatase [Flavobacterium sp.]|uniref:tyrosine-protein phosphatase n=1 Tax=Flavobacterium sp. TaxID=239 RepID=UPI0026367FE5|nr:CpsB/CapC family capsule biosynthesis tyrosine phosphatase [Flavobacterium sp.]
MFHFLKKKVFLKDLIPSGYVDIHSHLLPGIDDGASAIEDTLFLTQELQDLGFEQCITTPHIMKSVWDNTPEIIESAYQSALTVLKKERQLSLRYGAEYLIDPNFVTLFETGSLLTLKDNYVLVELSYLNPPIQLYNILFDLQIAGYRPVLAHPERYLYYHQQFRDYEKLKNAGCLFQLNMLSTVGYYGVEVAKAAENLLQKGMIDYVGSDVHHGNHIKAFSNKILLKDPAPLKKAIENNQFFRW